MVAQGRAGQLQKSIIACSALGILAAGVIVALASILPLYDHLKKVQEDHLISELNSRTRAVEEYLSRAAYTAARITKSEDSIEVLENYHNGLISRDELMEATRNALSAAMRSHEEVVCINRFDRKSDLVARVGDEAPEYELLKAVPTSVVATSSTPVTVAIPPFLVPPSRRQEESSVTGPLPEKLELVLGNQIYVAKEDLPPTLRNRLIRLAAFQNPEFYKAQAMRFPTFDKPRIISCCEDFSKHLGIPRGCLDELMTLLKSLKIETVITDERFGGTPIDVRFKGILRPEQHPAAQSMLPHEREY